MRRPGTSGIGSCAPISTARSCAVGRRRGAWSTPARAGASSTSPRFTKKPATCRMTVLLRGQGRSPHLTRAMALELGPHGITVNDVAPGMILTPMNRRALEDADYRADAGAQIPLRRPGTPEDIAAMVVFLCSGACVLLHRRDVSRRWRLDVELAAGLGKDQPMIAARRPSRRGLLAGGASVLAAGAIRPHRSCARVSGRPRAPRLAPESGADPDRPLLRHP